MFEQKVARETMLTHWSAGALLSEDGKESLIYFTKWGSVGNLPPKVIHPSWRLDVIRGRRVWVEINLST